MEHLTPPNPPPSEVVTDLEFIFLGGTKLVHVLREADTFRDEGNYFYLLWKDTGEDALLYKTSLLQFGRRVRMITANQTNAVRDVVDAIKQKEAKAQGAVGKAQASEPISLPGVGASVPEDLWDRSPLKR